MRFGPAGTTDAPCCSAPRKPPCSGYWASYPNRQQLARRNAARTLLVDASIARRAKVETMAHSSAAG